MSARTNSSRGAGSTVLIPLGEQAAAPRARRRVVATATALALALTGAGVGAWAAVGGPAAEGLTAAAEEAPSNVVSLVARRSVG